MLESGLCALGVATNAVVFGLVDPLNVVFFVEEQGGGYGHTFETCGPADGESDGSKEEGLKLQSAFMQETHLSDDREVRVTEKDEVKPVLILMASGSVRVVFA